MIKALMLIIHFTGEVEQHGFQTMQSCKNAIEAAKVSAGVTVICVPNNGEKT